MRRVGIVAGGGGLPLAIAEHLRDRGDAPFLARLTPFADAALQAFPGLDLSMGQVGTMFEAFRGAGCTLVCFAGVVRRVDLSHLSLDDGGAALLPRVLAAMPQGDDALLRVMVDATDEAGFQVVGAEYLMADLLCPMGPLGAQAPTPRDERDIAKAAQVAAALGAWDVGQGSVVCDGLVLALEAQEGTDAMLGRVAQLPESIRGSADRRRGVLVKRPKPQQERRIDLPTIGLNTIRLAAEAGLAGVAVQAGAALVMDRAAMIAAADAAGMFVAGVDLA
jgi:hypothetical protein